MSRVFEDAFHTLDLDVEQRVAVLKRTSHEAADAEEVRRAFDAMIAAVRDVPAGKYGLLLDVRKGPLKSDPGFDALVRPRIVELVGRFAFTAVFVRTAVGRLQLARYARELGMSIDVFDDERELVAHLEEAVRKLPPSRR